MRTVSKATLYVVTLFAAPGFATAQSGLARTVGRYSFASEVKLQGVVEQLESRRAIPVPTGSYIVLRTFAGVFDVQLGPYFKPTENLVPGETIEVTGSQIKTTEGTIVLARQLKVGSRVFTIRNANGFPVGRRNSGPRQ